MIEIDYGLISLALVTLFMRPSTETLRLLLFFSGSVIFVDVMDANGHFESLGYMWLMIYAAWITVFAINTNNNTIIWLYVAQGISCLLVLIAWTYDIKLVYNSYKYIIAGLYTMQIMVSYGNSNSGSYNKLLDRLVNLAHMGYGKWK
jgi:hypothetical protein